MNTEKIEKLKKGLSNAHISDAIKIKIKSEIAKLEKLDEQEVLNKKEQESEAKEINIPKPQKANLKKDSKKPLKPKTKLDSKSKTAKKIVIVTTERKKSGNNIMSVAKEIQKSGESWKDAIERAKDVLKERKEVIIEKKKSELEKLLAFVRTKKELQGFANSDINRDAVRDAKPRGVRFVTKKGTTSNQYGTFENKLGRKYWETRDRHADRLAPNYPKDMPLLAEGGMTDSTSDRNFIIKDWYIENYPNDELGEEIEADTTFKDIWNSLNNGTNVYDVLGVGDSLVRERVFLELSKIYNVDYNYVYEKWLDSDKYSDGGSIDSERLFNFLKDDLEKLQKAINEDDTEQIEIFFSYWLGSSGHLKSLETKTNERMYNFLKVDLESLRESVEDDDAEEVERFFSYWGQHLESLKMANGGKVFSSNDLWHKPSNSYLTIDNKSGVVKNVKEFNGNGKKEINIDGDVYRKNTTYGTYNSIKDNTILTKQIVEKNFSFADGGSLPFMTDPNFGDFQNTGSFELGGAFMTTDLAGHSGGVTAGLNANLPLSGVSGTNYTGLVGETGAMSSGELFENGGGIKMPDLEKRKKIVDSLSEEELKKWLSNNWGYRGFDSKAITRDSNKRSIDNLRKEVLRQIDYNDKNNYEAGGAMMQNQQVINDASQSYVNYYLGEGASQGIYKDGGSIPNNYEGRTAENVWKNWTFQQKIHFLSDHSEKINPFLIDNKGKAKGYRYDFKFTELIKEDYKHLPKEIKFQLDKHIEEGQYAKGGALKDVDDNLYVSISKTQDDYWVVTSKPTTKEQAEEMARLVTSVRGETEDVKTVGQVKAHSKTIYANGGSFNPNVSNKTQFMNGVYAYGGAVNGNINKKIKALAEKKGFITDKLGRDEYNKAMTQALVESLTDANFHAEAKQVVVKAEGKTKWSDELYRAESFNPDTDVASFAREVSRTCEWERDDIVNAYYFVTKMEGSKVANMIDDLFLNSKATKSSSKPTTKEQAEEMARLITSVRGETEDVKTVGQVKAHSKTIYENGGSTDSLSVNKASILSVTKKCIDGNSDRSTCQSGNFEVTMVYDYGSLDLDFVYLDYNNPRFNPSKEHYASYSFTKGSKAVLTYFDPTVYTKQGRRTDASTIVLKTIEVLKTLGYPVDSMVDRDGEKIEDIKYADGGMFDDNDGFIEAKNGNNYRYPNNIVHVDTIDEPIDLKDNVSYPSNEVVINPINDDVDLTGNGLRAKLSYEPKHRSPEKMLDVNPRMAEFVELPKPTSHTHKND